MRIFHTVALVSEDGSFGGPTTVAVNLLSELGKRDHSVMLIALWKGQRSPPRCVGGVEARLFTAQTFVPWFGALGLFNLRLARFIFSAAKSADIFHIHAGRDLVTLFTLLTCALRRVPYVVQTHGMIMPSNRMSVRIFDLALRPLLRRARTRFFLTDVEDSGLKALLGAVPLTRLPNGIPLPAPSGERLLAFPARVLFLARLHPRKRVESFVAAAALLHSRGLNAEFVVHGPDEGSLDSLLTTIRNHGLDEVVRYEGALSNIDSLRTLATAHVYVLPSVDEPFPMTLLEALSVGTPSVCTNSCGIAAILDEHQAAVVTDGSAEKLAAAIDMILSDPASWSSWSKRAEAGARDLFSISTVVDQLIKTYGGGK